MKYSCIDLLPQSSETLVRNNNMRIQLINSLFYMTHYLIIALRNFYLERQYYQYDPHVGETSCQIRAYENLRLSRTPYKSANLIRRLEQLMKIHEHIKTLNKKNQCGHNCQITTDSLFKQNDCFFEISETELFLVASYFLTEFKNTDKQGITYINHNAVSESLKITRKLSKKIVRHFQQTLALASCKTIFSWAAEAAYPTNELDVLKNLQLYDDDARPVLPCNFFTKIMLLHLIRKQMPILIVINRHNIFQNKKTILLFNPALSNKVTPILKISKETYSQACLVIYGETAQSNFKLIEKEKHYINRLNKLGLETVILTNMAAHPQYSGSTLLHYQQNPFLALKKQDVTTKNMGAELHQMLVLSEKSGCCREKSSLLMVNHFCCDTIRNVILKEQKVFGLKSSDYDLLVDTASIGQYAF